MRSNCVYVVGLYVSDVEVDVLALSVILAAVMVKFVIIQTCSFQGRDEMIQHFLS